jgi:hypothetical protein
VAVIEIRIDPAMILTHSQTDKTTASRCTRYCCAISAREQPLAKTTGSSATGTGNKNERLTLEEKCPAFWAGQCGVVLKESGDLEETALIEPSQTVTTFV